MNEPRRLLRGSHLDPIERELLQAGLDVEPPPDASRRVWSAVVAQLPPGALPGPEAAGPGAAGGGAAAGAAGGAVGGGSAGGATVAAVSLGASVLKPALAGALAMGMVLGGYSLFTPTSPPPPVPAARVEAAALAPALSSPPRRGESPERASVSASATPVASASASVQVPAPTQVQGGQAAAGALPTAVASAEVAPAEAPAASSAAAAASAPVSPMEERISQLRQEAELVGKARDALRSGDAASALRRLDEVRAQIKGGVLLQEREALTIEALARSGRGAEAAARARSFLAANPRSPYAAQVRGFAGP